MREWLDIDLEANTLAGTQVLPNVDSSLFLNTPKIEMSHPRLTLSRSDVTALLARCDGQAFERQAEKLLDTLRSEKL